MPPPHGLGPGIIAALPPIALTPLNNTEVPTMRFFIVAITLLAITAFASACSRGLGRTSSLGCQQVRCPSASARE